MSTTRIYAVEVIEEESTDERTRLVRAANNSQALRHVAQLHFKVRVASQEDLEILLPSGVKVEQAKQEDLL